MISGSRIRHIGKLLPRRLLLAVGCLAVAAGVVGIFLPLLPTVPFLLLAAACFSRSSERFHSWLVEHDQLGPLVRCYLDNGCIPSRAKWLSIGMILVSVAATFFFFSLPLWLKILLAAIATAVIVYLIRLPVGTSHSGTQRTW